MQQDKSGHQAVAVVLHDVAPATWPACEAILAKLAECGAFPVTHLIVPEYHGMQKIEDDSGFRQAIDARIDRGDELVLHGYFHLDQAKRTADPLQQLIRSVYTAGEGEFSALSREGAAELIERGRSKMAALGWHTQGFVPPAWLASRGTQRALEQAGLRYTSTRKALIDLHQHQSFDAPSLVWSTRAWWRRRTSAIWNSQLLKRLENSQQPLLRLGIHPADAQFSETMDFWINSLKLALEHREPMTKLQWLDSGVAAIKEGSSLLR